MNSLPTFKSDFLSGLIFALKKRRKAVKNKVESYSAERVVEKNDGKSFEKLELEFLLHINRASLRFYFWDDRVAWFDIRIPSKSGWEFEWTAEGRIGSTESVNILSSIEQSLELSNLPNNESLNSLWTSILLSGPTKNG